MNQLDESAWANQVKHKKAELFRSAQFAQYYQSRVYSDEILGRLKNLFEIQHVLEHARGRVLDVGAGTGRASIPLREAGHDVTAVDASAEMIGIGRGAPRGDDIDWALADVESLPFCDKAFDSVVSINVLSHIPQWRGALREFQRVCKPGGRLIFDTGSGDITRAVNRDEPRYGASALPGNAHAYLAEVPVAEMRDAIAACGLTLEAIVPNNVLNSNYWIQSLLQSRYETVFAEMQQMLLSSAPAIRFWTFVEKHVVPRLPADACYNYLVVAINGPGGSERVPQSLSAYPQRSVADFARACLGADYDWISRSAAQLLRAPGAHRFADFVVTEILRRIDPSARLSRIVDGVDADAAAIHKDGIDRESELAEWRTALKSRDAQSLCATPPPVVRRPRSATAASKSR